MYPPSVRTCTRRPSLVQLTFVSDRPAAVAILFSVIELGLGAGYIAKINSFDTDFINFSAPDFAKLAVAISVISLFVLTPLYVYLDSLNFVLKLKGMPT